jgi:hypothetical protein
VKVIRTKLKFGLSTFLQVGVQRQVSHAFAVLKFISMYLSILRNNNHMNLNIKKETEMPFVENTKIYAMNRLERNIIIGSLLGDGSLALQKCIL